MFAHSLIKLSIKTIDEEYLMSSVFDLNASHNTDIVLPLIFGTSVFTFDIIDSFCFSFISNADSNIQLGILLSLNVCANSITSFGKQLPPNPGHA
jgi:hypothetical protein